MKKITDQRCAVYFVADKEVSFTHSGLLVKLIDAVWIKIDKHTGLLFFLNAPYKLTELRIEEVAKIRMKN